MLGKAGIPLWIVGWVAQHRSLIQGIVWILKPGQVVRLIEQRLEFIARAER